MSIQKKGDTFMKVQIWENSCNRRSLEVSKVKNYFVANGCHVVWDNKQVDSMADIIYLSTCAFTQTAEDYALNTLQMLEKKKKSTCKIIIGGCLPKIHLEPIKDYISFGPRDYDKLDEIFPEFEFKYTDFSETNTYGPIDIQLPFNISCIEGQMDKKEAVSKIEEFVISKEDDQENFRIKCMIGCPCNCSYCAIKFAVGKLTSVPEDEIMSAVDKAIERGYKKIYFEGDCLGAYGLDIGTNLGKLLDKVIDRIKEVEVEVSITDVAPFYLNICMKQIQELAILGKLNHFFVPIQSGNERILGLMRRKCNVDDLKHLLIEFRQRCPHVRLGTSIIAGFPSETEEEFDDTIRFCKEVKFDYIWQRNFSARKGTEAENLEHQISDKIKYSRICRLKEEVGKIWCDTRISLPSMNADDYNVGSKAQG